MLSTLSISAYAQTDPAPATPPPSDELVRMSAFTVSTEKDVGYKASNSIAGTRSNTPIKDIPVNIQVFTPDLAEDILAQSQIELERYNASLVNGGYDVHSDNTIQQQYNGFLFRGFVQNWGLRDGVRQYDPIDIQGIARVEIVKGPVAALYGLSYPGGVMNSISKEVAFDRNFTAIRLTAQTEGQFRGTIDSNYTAKTRSGGTFGVRFNGAYAETEDYREHSEGMSQFSQVNLEWRPLADTQLKLLIEDGYREKPNGLGYFSTPETDGSGNSLNNRADVPLQVTHPNIPWTWNWATGNMRSIETTLVRGTINQAIGEDLQINAYWLASSRKNIDSDGWDASGGGGSAASWDVGFSSRGAEPTGWINPNTPAERIRMVYHYRDWDNTNHAYGATAVYKLDLDFVQNTFTAGAHVWSENFLTKKGLQPAGTTSFVDYPVRAGISLPTPIGPPSDYFMDVAGAYGHEDNSNDYYFASWQVSALENRLKLNAAVNRTNLKLVNWGSGTATVPNITEQSKTSPMFGAVFDVTKEVSVFAVYSTSLFPTTDKNDFEVQMPPVVGKSYEVGVKTELLNGKISGTLSYYQITQEGGAQRDPSAFNRNKQLWDSYTPTQRAAFFPGLTRDQLPSRDGRLGDFVPGGESESKGFEADLVIQPIPQLQILLSYAHNSVEVTQAVDRTTIGQSTTGSIENQLAVLAKYSITSGSAEGLSFGLGLQHSGKALQDYNGPNNAARYNPSTFYAEAFSAYKFNAFGYDQRVQLNVRNISEQEEYVGWRATGSSSRIATERYEVPTEMVISLTYGIDF